MDTIHLSRQDWWKVRLKNEKLADAYVHELHEEIFLRYLSQKNFTQFIRKIALQTKHSSLKHEKKHPQFSDTQLIPLSYTGLLLSEQCSEVHHRF